MRHPSSWSPRSRPHLATDPALPATGGRSSAAAAVVVDVDGHVSELAVVLRELAAISDDAFMHVCGQALATSSEWRRLLETAGTD